MLKPIKRMALLAAGMLCIILGVIGIFLPILPTTPFVLLAAACFARSCDSCYAWLVGHRWFGSFIRNWQEHRGVTRRQKATALALLWAGIAVTIAYGSELLWVRLMLVAIAACTTLYLILGLKTVEPRS